MAEVLDVADGCIVGSALKVDGDTWKPGRPRPRRRLHGPRAGREGRMRERIADWLRALMLIPGSERA